MTTYFSASGFHGRQSEKRDENLILRLEELTVEKGKNVKRPTMEHI